MPTTRPRHQVTETPDVAHALDVAARRWPERPRAKLLVDLVRLAGEVLEHEQLEHTQARRLALMASSGKYAEAFGAGYLDQLREDWPQ